MIHVLLAAMLAQVTAAPDASPAPSDGATTVPISFPRGPRRNPIETPSLAADDVLIRNSGSTNTAGYAIVIHKNGTAEFGGQQKVVGAPQVKWLYAKLEGARPFTQLGGMHCMKSASFGSVTTISYAGDTTPDLSCPGGPQVRELARTVGVIVAQLGIDTRRPSNAMRM